MSTLNPKYIIPAISSDIISPTEQRILLENAYIPIMQSLRADIIAAKAIAEKNDAEREDAIRDRIYSDNFRSIRSITPVHTQQYFPFRGLDKDAVDPSRLVWAYEIDGMQQAMKATKDATERKLVLLYTSQIAPERFIQFYVKDHDAKAEFEKLQFEHFGKIVDAEAASKKVEAEAVREQFDLFKKQVQQRQKAIDDYEKGIFDVKGL